MTKQLTFQQTLDRQKKWTEHHPEQQSITFSLAEWICNAVLPYTIVEDDRLKVMINQLKPKVCYPKREEITSKYHSRYIQTSLPTYKMITASDIFHFCFITTHIWSSQSMHSFISTTLHFIDNNWKPKMVVSKCFPIDESHTGQHIADVLGNILQNGN